MLIFASIFQQNVIYVAYSERDLFVSFFFVAKYVCEIVFYRQKSFDRVAIPFLSA